MAQPVVDRTGFLAADAAQHAANVAFARGYEARPFTARANRKRVLVSAFGRFPSHEVNATATLVCRMAGAEMPRAPHASGPGTIDDPAAHVLVADFTMTLPQAGEVDARALVLPVFWDVAAIVALREIDAFAPDVVMMNGIGRPEQPIVLERSALNREAARDDASLRVRGSGGEIVVGGARVRHLTCAADAIAAAAGLEVGEAREDNAYLCNQLTYVVEHVLANPGRGLRLLQRSPDDDGVTLGMSRDRSAIQRLFVHWPASLAGARLEAAEGVVRRAIDAQLAVMRDPR